MATRCTNSATESKEVDSKALRKQNEPTLVETVKAVRKPFNYEIHTNGEVKAKQETTLGFKEAGGIELLPIKEGDYVKKGQLLATLTISEHALALEKAKINLKERQLEYQNQLLATGIRGDSLQRATVQENLAYVTGLKAAELALKQAQQQFNNTSIRAPFSGVISGIEISQGAMVKQGDILATISNNAEMWVEAEVLESVIGKIKVSQKAQVAPLALDKQYTARVQTINPRVNDNGAVKLGLRINAPHGLMPGMHVAVSITAPYNKNIIIPETALVIRSGKEVVFVDEGGLAKWNYVTTGLKSNNEVEVLTGLKEGDDVITTNNIYLAHDTPVKIANNKTNKTEITINK